MIRVLLRGLLLGLLAFAIFGPLVNLLVWSVAEAWFFPAQLPQRWGFRWWAQVFRPTGTAWESLFLSVLIALLTTLLALAVAAPAGFALARTRAGWRSAAMLALLLPQAFPSLAAYINVARLFYALGLNGTILGVVLVHTVQALVYAVWIAAAAFAAVPTRLEQAARGLGCGAGDVVRRVTLPLAAPGLAAASVFVFLESLDEFTGSWFVGAPDVMTMPLTLYTASQGGNMQVAAVTAIVLLVPSVGFMLVVERWLRADVLAQVGR